MTKPATSSKQPKVAIVHDWLIGGGAERVVYELHQMYPEAPIYTTYATREWRDRMDGKVRTGILQHWPFSKFRKFIPVLRVWWVSRLKLEGYDLVISSSGAEIKGVRVSEGTVHVNYCHAPTHYYWSRYDEYMKHPGFGPLDPLARIGLRTLVGPLREWDYKAAQRPHHILANSTHTKHDIKTYYDRTSKVVFPPVDIDRFKPTGPTERFGFVIAGRQTPYKRIDLAVAACTKLGVPLKVIGRGPDHDKLTAIAGPTIRFMTNVTDADIVHHFQTAEAFLFPGVDDFGIVAVEALAAGTPVIAYRAGGALDYVEEGVTGMLFDDQTADCLAATLQDFQNHTFDHKRITRRAQRFSVEKFRSSFTAAVSSYTDTDK